MGQVKEETVRGAKWDMLQRLTTQPLAFAYSIILARLVTPEEMGIIGLTAIFFAVAGTLASSGFASALIRKLDRSEADCNTMFWFNLGMSVLMSLALCLLAPWFVELYHQPELLWLTRCSAAMMLLSSSASVHWALYRAHRDFKTLAIIQTAGTVVSMPIGLILAYQGYGVWALMGQQVASSLISLVAVWYVSPWKPRFIFSTASFRELFGFGSKLAASGLLNTIYTELQTYIIGLYYSAASLGFYNKGNRVARLVPGNITSMVLTVSYPVLAPLQNDLRRLSQVYRMYLRTSTLPVAWASLTMVALATPFISLFYGEDWLASAFFVQVVSLVCGFDPIYNINLNLLQVLGRSDLYLRLEIIKKTISVAMLLYAATISIEAICWASVIYMQIAIVFNCYYTGKVLGLTWWRQQCDYMPFYILAALAAAPGYALSCLTDWPDLAKLAVGGMSSFALYFGYLAWRRDEALKQYLGILMEKPFFRRIAEKTGIARLAA